MNGEGGGGDDGKQDENENCEKNNFQKSMQSFQFPF